jgi:hypothetical protein
LIRRKWPTLKTPCWRSTLSNTLLNGQKIQIDRESLGGAVANGAKHSARHKAPTVIKGAAKRDAGANRRTASMGES